MTGETIVCLATQEWDAHWSVAQQVASRLAPANRVIYVEPFHPPLSRLRKRHGLLRRQHQLKVPALREVQPNLTVFRPCFPYLPGNMRLPFAAALNSLLYRRELKAILQRLGVQRPIFWSFFAQSLSFLDLERALFVYDCVDDWPSFFPNPLERAWVARIDERLCRQADLIFAGSDPLAAKKQAWNPECHVVNHAADVEHFMQANHPATLVPSELDGIPHPRIGFAGMIDSLRFDFEIILRLAENPANQIVIVGGFMNGAESLLPERPNVHRLGMKPVAQLPAYLKGMDVCVMPYLLNETTRYIFPLKLFEYLAAGRPVVATPIPAVQQHFAELHVAAGPEDFESKVHQALKEDTPERRLGRQSYAGRHDWRMNVSRKSKLVQEKLREREHFE